MITIPEEVLKAWEDRQIAPVLTTVSKDGIPNSIYATCVSIFNDKVLIANNKFDKTYKNISENNEANVLFITETKKAYQLKGKITYKTEGAEFDDMKKWNRKDLPGKGVAILDVTEVYSGAKKLA